MTQAITLVVTGMMCGGCETTAQDKLNSLAGVKSATSSHQDNTISVEFESEQITQQQIEAAIVDARFTVE